MKRTSGWNLAIALTLILLAVVLRVMPHPANFAPIATVALFGGAILPKRYALSVPLAAMVTSDLIIGLHSLVLVTWGCFALIALASFHWLRQPTLRRGAAMAMAASVFFFTATNLAVWLWSGMYAHSWAGLARCYELALPFFRNTALSDIIYTAALFGAYAVAVKTGQKLADSQLKKLA